LGFRIKGVVDSTTGYAYAYAGPIINLYSYEADLQNPFHTRESSLLIWLKLKPARDAVQALCNRMIIARKALHIICRFNLKCQHMCVLQYPMNIPTTKKQRR
jgi:hypothetical protein